MRYHRTYRCLDCGEHVYLRKGEVRQAHFAHYAQQAHPCSAETVLHQAAKYHLVALLNQGLKTIDLSLACKGYEDTFGSHNACPGRASLTRALAVPPFDTAKVEMPFGSYRLDAAARAGAVVLALEVYHHHRVDAHKRTYLFASGIPWVELYAEDVLELPMPWQAVSSHLGSHQCAGCHENEVSAAQERKRRVAAEAARYKAEAEARQREAERKALADRIVPVARKGQNLIFGRRDRIGLAFTCLVCKKRVIATQVDANTIGFLHDVGQTCDPRRAWVKAGMWAVYKQLERAPAQIRILRRCSGYGCNTMLATPLPAFDRFEAVEPSLILYQDDKPLMQLVFGHEPQLVDATDVLTVRPGKVAHRPTNILQRKNGDLCLVCSQRLASELQTARIRREAFARELAERERTVAEIMRRRQVSYTPRNDSITSSGEGDWHLNRLRRQVARRQQDPARVQQAASFVRGYFARHHIALKHAQAYGVVVRRCEHCREPVAILIVGHLKASPTGLENVLAITHTPSGTHLQNKCGTCGGLLTNEHDRAEPKAALYLLPEELGKER